MRWMIVLLSVFALSGCTALAVGGAAAAGYQLGKDEQLKIGITPAMCRISVGLEDPEDLIADVSQALDKI